MGTVEKTNATWNESASIFIKTALLKEGDLKKLKSGKYDQRFVGRDFFTSVVRPALRGNTVREHARLWNRILKADNNLSPSFFMNAIGEICDFYGLNPVKPESLELLIERYPDALLDHCGPRSKLTRGQSSGIASVTL